ncbi:MAG: hypothetical protein WC995_03960 [Lysobacteraceae bacterium]
MLALTLVDGNGAMPGSPFFWSLFFGETKKSDSAAAEADETPTTAQQSGG